MGEVQRSRRVLVMDDNQDLVEAVAMTLEIVGHRVATARNGVRALEAGFDHHLAKPVDPLVLLQLLGTPT